MQKQYLLHICNGSKIPFMFILKLCVDTFVNFLKPEVIITSLLIEIILFLDLQMIIQRRKRRKKMGKKMNR